jgi:hypothetical protein
VTRRFWGGGSIDGGWWGSEAAPPPRSWVTGRAGGCDVPKKRQRLMLEVEDGRPGRTLERG